MTLLTFYSVKLLESVKSDLHLSTDIDLHKYKLIGTLQLCCLGFLYRVLLTYSLVNYFKKSFMKNWKSYQLFCWFFQFLIKCFQKLMIKCVPWAHLDKWSQLAHISPRSNPYPVNHSPRSGDLARHYSFSVARQILENIDAEHIC